MRFFGYLIIIIALSLGVTGCYYDNEEDLYPQAIECDTLNVTYSSTIAPIMESSCNDCHGGTSPSANISTDTYEGLKDIAEDGRLWGAVNHEDDYSPMPKDRPKLNDCDLKLIQIWIDNGALND